MLFSLGDLDWDSVFLHSFCHPVSYVAASLEIGLGFPWLLVGGISLVWFIGAVFCADFFASVFLCISLEVSSGASSVTLEVSCPIAVPLPMIGAEAGVAVVTAWVPNRVFTEVVAEGAVIEDGIVMVAEEVAEVVIAVAKVVIDGAVAEGTCQRSSHQGSGHRRNDGRSGPISIACPPGLVPIEGARRKKINR